MSSREKILNAVKQSRPEEVLLEELPFFPLETRDLTDTFRASLEGIGGRSTLIEKASDIPRFINEGDLPESGRVIGLDHWDRDPMDAIRNFVARDLEAVQVAVIKGDLGVAENGAVWVTEQNMGHRILPFITQHLVLVLEERCIVGTMQDAYRTLSVAQEGYGVFIAGPSKTADIEQSLVIGAHGPIAMQVYIIKNKSERA